MLTKALKKLVEDEGYPVMGDVVQCARFSEPVGFSYLDAANSHAVTVMVNPETWTKDIQKELKKSLKKYGALSYIKAHHIVQLTVSAFRVEKMIRSMEDGADALMAALREKGVEIASTCHYCKQGNSDSFAAVTSYCVPAHSACKEQEAQKILEQVEANETGGNMLLGILGALLGGIVGALPAVLVPYFTDDVYPILYILIPVASYQGYKLLKGVLNGLTPFIVAIFSLVSTVFSEMLYYYLVIYQPRGIPFHWMAEDLFTSPGVAEYFLKDMAFSLLFCVVGIGLTWSLISKGNKHLRQQANAIVQSVSETVDK